MKSSDIYLVIIMMIVFSFALIPSAYAWHEEFFSESKVSTPSIEKNSELNGHFSRPSFGLDHENNKKIVDYGFKLNENKFKISNNFHTPFIEQTINIGEKNTFEAKVYSEKGLRIQEFLFGISEVGEAHNAELGIEVWIDSQGEIQNIRAIQDTDIVDPDHILATHEKVKCLPNSAQKDCNLVRISVTFMEPIEHKIMAIKAIDLKNRYQITYLNEGIILSGESLNPMQTLIIPSNTKNMGPIEITQLEKYSTLWTSEDGRIFERNSFGSFREIINTFERHTDSGEPRNRTHSEFGRLIENEENRAYNIFNATTFESYLPKTFSYTYPEENERIDPVMNAKLKVQELIAKKMIEQSQIQARFSNINS